MSELSGIEAILSQAGDKEKRYDWLETAEFYVKALAVARQDLNSSSEIQERIGYCFFRAAFQAETCQQFKSRSLDRRRLCRQI